MFSYIFVLSVLCVAFAADFPTISSFAIPHGAVGIVAQTSSRTPGFLLASNDPWAHLPPKTKRTHLFAGGSAVLIELDKSCTNVKRVVHIGEKVRKIASAVVDGKDRFALILGTGVGVLDHKLRPVWEKSSEERPQEIAIGSDGTVAFIIGFKKLVVFDEKGELILERQFDDANLFFTSLAINGATKSLIIGGFQARPTLHTPTAHIAFVDSSDYKMEDDKWGAWGYEPEEMGGMTADTKIAKIRIGGDGNIYIVGESAGRYNLFRANPLNATEEAKIEMAHDPFHDVRDHISLPFQFIARLHPDTGALLNGTFIRAYNVEGSLEALPITGHYQSLNGLQSVSAIAADKNGVTIAAAWTGAEIKDRKILTVAGTPVAPYRGKETAAIQLSSTFAREAWGVFTGEVSSEKLAPVDESKGVSSPIDIAISDNRAALLFDVFHGSPLSVHKPFKYDPPAGSPSAFIVVWDVAAPPPKQIDGPKTDL